MLYEKFDYVLAIAEEQNLTRAAKKLYISQPTLTMYLNRLEESLGVQLFDRKKAPITLTAAGNHYIERMKEIADAEQILRGELRTVTDPAQTFRIGCPRVRAHFWLPSLMRLLQDRHPNLNFVLSLGTEHQLVRTLKNDSIDMMIGSISSSAQNDIPLIIDDLILEKTLLAAHKSFGLIPAEVRENYSPYDPYPLDPAKLDNLPFISPSTANGIYPFFQKMLVQYNIHPSRSLVIDTMMTGLMMAEQGLGVQFISAGVLMAIPTEERRRELDYCVLPNFPAARKCSVAWREDTEMLPLIEETVQLLRTEVLPKMLFTEVI